MIDPPPALTRTVFVAHLVPKVPAEMMSDDHAGWLIREPGAGAEPDGPPPTDRSFVYVKGPNAEFHTSADGRYQIAICGHYSIPACDTSFAEWMTKAYDKRSTDCLVEINGSWRALIIDNKRGTAVTATDRMGTQRICYSIDAAGRLTIAHNSDIVGVVRGERGNIHPNSVLRYFYFHCIPSPSTFFEDIQALGPSEILVWNGQGGERRRYWEPQFTARRNRRTRVEPVDLLSTLDSAIGSYSSSGRTAAFLSGGLDSSTVLGLACRNSTGSVSPFTIGFDEPAYDETEYARIAADHFGVTLNRYEVTPKNVIDAISTVARIYDEPFGNSSAIPTYFCAKAAVDAGHTRILAGDGGDELFAGNERYRMQQIFALYETLPAAIRRHLLEPVFLQMFASASLFPIRKIRRYIEQARLPMPDRLQTYNFLHIHGIDNIFTPRFLDEVDVTSPLRHLREIYSEANADNLIDKMLYLDWKLTLADNDLRKVSAMCEEAGIAVEFPMLDNRLVDISCRIPGSVKMRRGQLRSFFKESVQTLLPKEILTKPKHGFGLPFGPWFAKSEELRKHMLELLDSFGRRNIVRPDYIERVRQATVSEHAGYHGEMIWVMCVFETWLSMRPGWRDFRF